MHSGSFYPDEVRWHGFVLVAGAVGLLAVGCLGGRHGPPEFLVGTAVLQPEGKKPRSNQRATYSSAALSAAGVAVSAAGNRAVAKTCWASCRPGTECDEQTGTCVELPCGGKCPAEHRCEVVEGKEACIRAEPDRR